MDTTLEFFDKTAHTSRPSFRIAKSLPNSWQNISSATNSFSVAEHDDIVLGEDEKPNWHYISSSTIPHSLRLAHQVVRDDDIDLEEIETPKFSNVYFTRLLAKQGTLRKFEFKCDYSTVLSGENTTLKTLQQYIANFYLQTQIVELFRFGRQEDFDDPITTDFARELISLMIKYGEIATQIIEKLILHKQVEFDIAEQALKIIGMDETRSNHTNRRYLLESCLTSDSMWIRNGAIKGISYMDDPDALSAITKALEVEQIPELREYMLYLQRRYIQMQVK